MAFNIQSVLEFADKVTDAVKRFAPVASDFGVPFVEKVANLADTAVDILQNAVTRGNEAKEVLSSNDQARIDAKINELRTVADELNQRILNT